MSVVCEAIVARAVLRDSVYTGDRPSTITPPSRTRLGHREHMCPTIDFV